MKILSDSFKKQRTGGFTIVELLIVIVVIGILAAITIVAFNGVRSNASNAVLQSDLRNVATELMNQKTIDGGFPSALSSLNGGSGPKKSESTQFDYSVAGDSFCVSAQSTSDPKAKKYHFASNENSVKEGACPGPWSFVGVGWNQSCGVSKSLLYCWGQNDQGQLGNGTTSGAISTPTAVYSAGVLSGKTITKFVGGVGFSCAIASERAYCWGSDYSSALGHPFWIPSDGQYRPKAVYIHPTDGVPDATVADIAAGQKHACAIIGGEAWCWGSNEGANGLLGNNSTAEAYNGVRVATDTGLAGKTLTKITSSDYHTCALTTTNQMYCWGSNASGALGDGNSNVAAPKPVAVNMSGVLAGKTVTSIAAGSAFTCVIASGKAYCWGDGQYAALGNGTGDGSVLPAAVDDSGVLAGKTLTSIAAGASHACATTSDGGVYCWGSPSGNGYSGGYALSPQAVDVANDLQGKSIQSVVAGRSHTCAKSDDDWIYCWGLGNNGQLGQGSGSAPAIVKVAAP